VNVENWSLKKYITMLLKNTHVLMKLVLAVLDPYYLGL